LLAIVSSDSLAASSTKLAVAKARALEPHVGTMESYLFSDPSMITVQQVKEVLRIVAPSYQELQSAEQDSQFTVLLFDCPL